MTSSAVLDAGSIAVAASAGVSIITKSVTSNGSLLAISQLFIAAIVALWLSLIGAVGHNFFFVFIGKLDAAYSDKDVNRTILRKALELTAEINPSIEQSLLDQLRDASEREPLKKQRRNVTAKLWLMRLASVFGYFSIASFIIAFSLVAVCIVKILLRVQ